jgi:hypothetical protein
MLNPFAARIDRAHPGAKTVIGLGDLIAPPKHPSSDPSFGFAFGAVSGELGEGERRMAAKNPTGEPDPAPFKVHLMTRAGRIMRARSEPVRAFSTKDEAVRFAGRQLGGHYAVYHKHRKIWPAP